MTHPILQGIRSMKRRLVRRTWLAGGLRVFALALVVGGILGAIDYLVRVSDPGVRLMMSGAFIVAVIAGAWRWVVRPLFGFPTDVELARRVIEHDPRLGEELPTAVEFLKQSESDQLAGSVALRRAVVIEATTRTEGIAWDRFVDAGPLRRAVVLALVPLIAVLALTLWRPQLVAVGAFRLAVPLGDTDWPRMHHLHFVKAPERLASGDPFEVELVDRGERLPDEVWIHYRFLRDGQPVEVREAMQRYGETMVARRESVTQPFAYRAVGGDHRRMPWRHLDVVEPPRLRSLELTLHPPAYAGLPPMASDRHVRALAGTQIELQADVTHPLVRAEIVSENGQSIEARVGENGTNIRVPPGRWTADESSRWSLVLEDEQGLVGGGEDTISVHVSPDPPPTVTMDRPAMDQYVVPQATVAVSVGAKDNLAVRDISLTFLRSDESDKDRQRIELYRGPAEPPRHDVTSLALLEADRHTVEHTWDLSPLGLSPGTFLALHAQASDYQGEIGQTPLPRNIYIVSLAELEARLAEQQDVLLAELERALRLEREARAEVEAVQIQLTRIGQLSQRDIDTLQAVEINQRHIAELLAGPEEGILARIAALRADLAANRIESPDILRRLDELDRAIQRLATDHLPVIQRELTSAIKTATADAAAGDRLGESLGTATAHQDAVIESLAALLGDFSRWSDYRRFARDVSQLRADQQRLAQTTREDVGLDDIRSDLNRMDSQALADREKVTRRQLALARRLESLQQQMEKTATELAEQDPIASTTLADAVEAARRHRIDLRMRQVADFMEQNQVGRAVDAQGQIDESLREVLSILRNTRESELRRLVSKLRQAEQDMQLLRNEVAGLRSKMDAAGDAESKEESKRQLQRLLREKNELQEEIARMSRRLMRLTAEQAGRSTSRAASRLGQDGQAGANGQSDSPVDQLRAAERDLEQAQAELAEARQKAEADLAHEQLAGMQSILRGLADRQQHVVDEVLRLDEQRTVRGEWTFGQLESLVSLAEEQQLLHEETMASGEKMAGLGVIRAALQSAATDMLHTATGLKRRDTRRSTQRHAQSALRRLEIVLAALNDADQNTDDAGGGQDGGGDQSGGDQDGPSAEQGPTIDLAELRLLKLMQLDLRRRTAQAEEDLRAGGEDQKERQQRYKGLAEEQGQLATLAQDLLEKVRDRPDKPEVELPDLDDALEQDDALPELDL